MRPTTRPGSSSRASSRSTCCRSLPASRTRSPAAGPASTPWPKSSSDGGRRMAPDHLTLATLHSFAGCELGVSEWQTLDQQRIDRFAECTGDHQWIHVDPERARRESPFGTTIAHGDLTLSLLARTTLEIVALPLGLSQALNYGLDRVRFLAPVRAGSRVRNR